MLRLVGFGAAVTLVAGLAACAPANELFEIAVGDCLNSSDITSNQIMDVNILDCTSKHDLEVYAALEMDDAAFPGSEAAGVAAEAWCTSQFEAFVGIPYESSELSISWIFPSEETWKDRGDREILCLLGSPEPVAGSQQGSER